MRGTVIIAIIAVVVLASGVRSHRHASASSQASSEEYNALANQGHEYTYLEQQGIKYPTIR